MINCPRCGFETYQNLIDHHGFCHMCFEETTGEQPPLEPDQVKRNFSTGPVHHSHNFPRCGNCGAIVRVPAGSCEPCSNCLEPLSATCG